MVLEWSEMTIREEAEWVGGQVDDGSVELVHLVVSQGRGVLLTLLKPLPLMSNS